MFIPTTPEELEKLGWDTLDVILVTGDSYVDSPYIGAAIIGQVLLKAGYRAGIIAQPDLESDDICRLGKPSIFWGVTGGSIDSMVANYTATKKPKKWDDLTPGGQNNRRPNRAVIAYTNLIKRHFKETVPIVLGGVEASLRRVAHYDYWSNKIRRSILFDAKADILVYGMAEKTILELTKKLKSGEDYSDVRGICYISKEVKADTIELPSFEQVAKDKQTFIEMFHKFYQNNDPITAQGLSQLQDTRYLIQNPPAHYLTQDELDEIHSLPYVRTQHPFYEKLGTIRALETIKFSVTTHRGCYGECNFCAIAVHQGRTVRWRSINSVVDEVEHLAKSPDFKGYIQDVGGPTANMYGFECQKKLKSGNCTDKHCLTPEICPALKIDHGSQRDLLSRLRKIKGIKKAFVSSGIRYDMVLKDHKKGIPYLKDVVQHHTSGQLKIAPEHTEGRILRLMGKPGRGALLKFKDLFYKLTQSAHKNQFLTYYMIAAHPGCTERDMHALQQFSRQHLKAQPEQTQIFTPTPSTYSTLMYYTEMDPFTGENLYVEKDSNRKERQKQILTGK